MIGNEGTVGVNAAVMNDSKLNLGRYSEAISGYYYNSDRTATISVNEKNFDTEDYTFKVNSKYGNSVTLGSWSQSGDEYTCKVVFKGDDEYSASFSCEDKAGNKSDEIKVDRFVVDKTAPKLDCSYDNTFAHKANYYNAARTAKITVNDMSFTSDLVDIDNSSDQNVTITGWSGDGNSYSSEILCTADGKYQFYVYAEDLAGNKSERLDCGSFIIDTTAPTIEISGVMDKSANSGAVIPTVNCKDINLDNDNSIVTVSGYKNGVVNPSDINLVDGSGKNVTYNIFAFEKVSDDIYTVTVVAEDMAGNKAEISYMFSVNRFGSTFGVTQQTADLVGKYYTNAEQDLVLLETNVDNVDEQELYITKNGKNIKLVKGVDYFVEKEGTDATWKAYTYTVKKNNFVEEGTYEVSLFTKDKAGNQSDSNAQGMTIKFAVDKTAPSIVVAGIEDSKLYESSSLDINIDVQDNMEINYAEILIDGKVVKKYAANELNDIVTYSIEESEDSMTVIVRAVDVVGNLSEKKYENVVVSTIVKAEETVEVKDEIVPLSDADSTQEIVKSSEIDNVLVPDNNSLAFLSSFYSDEDVDHLCNLASISKGDTEALENFFATSVHGVTPAFYTALADYTYHLDEYGTKEYAEQLERVSNSIMTGGGHDGAIMIWDDNASFYYDALYQGFKARFDDANIVTAVDFKISDNDKFVHYGTLSTLFNSEYYMYQN